MIETLNQLIKIGQVSYFPAIPAKEGRPARCVIEYYEHIEYQVINGVVTPVSVKEEREVCYPAIPPTPAVPASDASDPKTGWNAGAISRNSFIRNCSYEFNFSENPIGIISGLSDGGPARNYYKISHGFLMQVSDTGNGHDLFIIENGIKKEQLFNYYSFSKFRIDSINENVFYYIDNQLVHTSRLSITGNKYAEATLYMLNDYVIYPRFISLDNDISSPIYLIGGVTNRTDNFIDGAINLRGTLETGNYIDGKLDIQGRIVQGEYNEIDGKLPPLRASLEGDDAPIIEGGVIYGQLLPLYMEPVYVPIGGIATIPDSPIYLRNGIITDYEYYSEINSSISPISGIVRGDAIDKGYQEQINYLGVGDTLITNDAYIVLFYEELSVISEIDLFIFIHAEFLEQLLLSDDFSLSGFIKILMNEKINIVNNANINKNTFLTNAINAATYAASHYDNFDFKKYVYANGNTYGLGDDGLYIIAGDSDNGEYIEAEIDFGAKDFGVPNLKRISSAYLGIRSDGKVYLKTYVDSNYHNTYELVYNDNYRRTFMSKGASGRYWRFKLKVVDASFALLDSVELEVGISNRRIRGR